MELPLQITTRNLSLSDAAEEAIRDKAGKLDTFYDRIISCRVLVEVPHRHKNHGMLYDLHIYISVPGNEIVVKREANEDLYVAIRNAFEAAKRQLKDHSQRQRGDVKKHEGNTVAPQGVISKLFPRDDYGFIDTSDGREIYFHRNSVKAGGFDKLATGIEVNFVEEQGDEGPQASVVVATN